MSETDLPLEGTEIPRHPLADEVDRIFMEMDADAIIDALEDSKRLDKLRQMLSVGCSGSAQPSEYTKGYMAAMGQILKMLEEPDHE